MQFAQTGWAGTRLGLILLGLQLLTGCNPGVRWELGRFQDIHSRSRAANKPTFVYFRNWYLVECTNFEEHVLKDPEVLAETQNMVCVPLDYDWDRTLAEQWKLTTVPAYVIVAPDGTVLARGQAPITREELLAEMRQANEIFAPPAAPSTTTPASPP
ncbi:MAG: thioredoxin family protein [Phycisphaerae bacterium]|nr:thioredoxin family protein [Phycisphaerae bacterium]